MITALLERPNVPAVHLDLPADLAAADAVIWAALREAGDGAAVLLCGDGRGLVRWRLKP